LSIVVPIFLDDVRRFGYSDSMMRQTLEMPEEIEEDVGGQGWAGKEDPLDDEKGVIVEEKGLAVDPILGWPLVEARILLDDVEHPICRIIAWNDVPVDPDVGLGNLVHWSLGRPSDRDRRTVQGVVVDGSVTVRVDIGIAQENKTVCPT